MKTALKSIFSTILTIVALNSAFAQCPCVFGQPKLYTKATLQEVSPTNPVQVNTEYFLDIPVLTPMDPNLSIVVLPTVDGLGYPPYYEPDGTFVPFRTIPPHQSGVDITPQSTPRTLRFTLMSNPTGQDLGDVIYVSYRAECQDRSGPVCLQNLD